MAAIISTVKNPSLVNATEWKDMSINDLLEQKNILLRRYDFMITQDNGAPLAKKILEGVEKVEELIRYKSTHY